MAVVGNVEHEEVVGLLGECDAPDGARAVLREEDVEALPFPEDAPVGVVCQTTLSAGTVNGVLSVLRARYPHIEESPASDTCTATRDRQRAVDEFVRAGEPSSTGVLVVGSARSSNTARLAEIASSTGAKAWRVDGAEALGGCDFAGIGRLGVTAGASTPERVVRAVLDALTARSRP